mmetsp:Transcript_19417/g.29491  ORF Transcript_19417/g.29491 Transcript_19417/m.29491 type:complete len:86 (-) Transcript_19417:1359-1616(-)
MKKNKKRRRRRRKNTLLKLKKKECCQRYYRTTEAGEKRKRKRSPFTSLLDQASLLRDCQRLEVLPCLEEMDEVGADQLRSAMQDL